MCVSRCLCVCSRQSWLYTLEQMRGSDSTVLTEDSVKMAAHFCLPVSVFDPSCELALLAALPSETHSVPTLSEAVLF